jgi:hypothetical protein
MCNVLDFCSVVTARDEAKQFALYDYCDVWYKKVFDCEATALAYLKKCYTMGWAGAYTRASNADEVRMPDLGYTTKAPDDVTDWVGECKVITMREINNINVEGDFDYDEALDKRNTLEMEYGITSASND